MADGSGAEPRRSRCPICQAYATADYRPFCSKHCADVDLGRWLNGNYRIPTFETPGAEEPGSAPEDDDRKD